MSNDNLKGLQDYLKLFYAYQKPQNIFEYALALKGKEFEIVLHVMPIDDKEFVTVIKEEDKHKWYDQVFLSPKKWVKIEATEIDSYVNNDHGDLFDFFMSTRKLELMNEEEWLKLLKPEDRSTESDNQQK